MKRKATSQAGGSKRYRTTVVQGYRQANGKMVFKASPGSRSFGVAPTPIYGPQNRPEKKGMDTTLTTPLLITASTNDNSFIAVANLMRQGAGSWERIGRKVTLRSLRIKGAFSFSVGPNGAGAANPPSVRCVVVWDKQPSSGNIPNFDTIFGTTDQAGGSVVTVYSPPRYENMGRFRVLKDFFVNTPPNPMPGYSPGGGNVTQFDIGIDEYVKLGNLETTYSGTSNPMSIAQISTGALYIVFRATVSAAPCEVKFDGCCRLRYID